MQESTSESAKQTYKLTPSKSKRVKDTNICLKLHRGELFVYEGGGVKYHFQTGEEETHLSFFLGHFIQTPRALESWLLSPIQGEPIEESWVPLITTNFKEFTFDVFVGLLEK